MSSLSPGATMHARLIVDDGQTWPCFGVRAGDGTNGTPADTDFPALFAKAQAKLGEAGDEDRAELVDIMGPSRIAKSAPTSLA
jgi:hypothetical protein